jgi:hypothetical protein
VPPTSVFRDKYSGKRIFTQAVDSSWQLANLGLQYSSDVKETGRRATRNKVRRQT